jgi:membrane peptidoglycan carboxypeptidase
LSARITQRFGPARVLEWSLNTARYGPRVYGADQASRLYFRKPASLVNLSEAAVLAAAAAAPPGFDPQEFPQAAIELSQGVLRRAAGLRLITPAQLEAALAAPAALQPPGPSPADPAAPFTTLALQELYQQLGRERVERGGLKVITTLDFDLQMQAACLSENGPRRLNASASTPDRPAPDGSPCDSARFLPPASGDETLSPAGLGAGLAVIDPSTGQTLALAGELPPGPAIDQTPARPSGTLFTPLAALTAFARGYSPASLMWDIPAPGSTTGNLDALGPLRLRTALNRDRLNPMDEVIQRIGPEAVRRTLQGFGYNPAGASENGRPYESRRTSLIQAAQTYAALANGGVLAGRPAAPGESGLRAEAILQVTDLSGNTAPSAGLQIRPVASPQIAALLLDALSDEPTRRTAPNRSSPLDTGLPAAAKLGRSPSGLDGWAAGALPGIAAAAWAGPLSGRSSPADSPARALPPGFSTAESTAAAVWRAFIAYATARNPQPGWTIPPGVSFVTVCDPSGLLPTRECPTTVREIFLSGSEPQSVDRLFQRRQVNRENNRLATVFTPSGLIDERVFMIPPPEAAAWVAASGSPSSQLALPQTYDVLSADDPIDPNVQISFPAPFQAVRGRVILRGAAGGPGFSGYRLEAGAGVNPSVWTQIGEDQTAPQTSGPLIEWNTQDLDGLYALQLQVVDQDNRVKRAYQLVTVDNQPPQVRIPYPQPGASISPNASGEIILHAEADDNLGVARLEFYIDGQKIGELSGLPYALPWKAGPGEHSLKIIAVDRAGNETSTPVVQFFVK